jgi:hypothetical protein
VDQPHEPVADLEAVLSKLALHELNVAYCRAVDRLDEPALVALFHPDATLDSGVLRGPPPYFAREFAAWVRENARLISHAVTNEWYRVDGDRAIGECYVIAVSRMIGPSGERDVLTVGRYFDRFERRSGPWKFLEKRFVLDHSMPSREDVAPLPPSDGPKDGRGSFGLDDPVYRFWQQF